METELEMSEMYPTNENSILKEILSGELLASPKEFIENSIHIIKCYRLV